MTQTRQAATLAVIGGSGFYEIDGLRDVQRVEIDTPFGPPSDALVLGTLNRTRIAFLPRHGVGHRLLPSELPQRANIWALASLGVEQVIAVSAVGSLREEIEPLDMVVPDQFIDKTHGRPATFFGRGIVAHIAFDAPVCPGMSAALVSGAREAGVRTHEGGTYVVMEGPAFSTRAESELHRSWGASVIGMTALPEAKLAREAGMCYGMLACVTDYDTWHPSEASVSVDLILQNLLRNVGAAKSVLTHVAGALPGRACTCKLAPATAIVTGLDLVPDDVKRDLAPILERARAAEVTA
jgi:5'-methylthioadenosine phosphorylase